MINNLVFSGGGLKCLCYIGVLKYFEEHLSLFNNLKEIVASSGGSIFALLFIIKYSYKELNSIILGLDFNNLKDINTHNLLNFFKNYGIDTGNKLVLLLNLLLKKKNINENITFSQLYKKFKIKFTITATCVNKNKIHYFNHINNANMSVVLAVRISSSIPLLFNYVKYNNNIYVDGGLLDNYPIHYLKSKIHNTLGFLIKNTNKEINIKTIDNFILQLLIMTSRKSDKLIESLYHGNTIFINCDVNAIDFKIDNKNKIKCIRKGYNSISKYYKNKLNKEIKEYYNKN